MKKIKAKYGSGRVYQPTYRTPDGKLKKIKKLYVQWYDQAGIQHRESTEAKTEKEARAILAMRLGQVHTGTAPSATDKSLTYGDIREMLLDDYRLQKRKSLAVLSNGRESFKGLAKLDEFFGFEEGVNSGPKVFTITPEYFDKFIIARRKEGVSDSTIRRSGEALRAMLNLAEKKGKLSRTPKIELPQAAGPREEYLTLEQFHQVRDLMDPQHFALLTFLFFQGTRVGEALLLDWKQIDLAGGLFYPNPKANKTGERHFKALNDEVVQVLHRIQRAKGLVFAVGRRGFEKDFRRAMLKLKLGRIAWECHQCRSATDDPAPTQKNEFRKCPNCETTMTFQFVGPSPHALRASTVVFYREAGMPDTEIMKITGHRTLEAFRGYSRSSQENLKKQMDAALANRERFLAELEQNQPRPRLVKAR